MGPSAINPKFDPTLAGKAADELSPLRVLAIDDAEPLGSGVVSLVLVAVANDGVVDALATGIGRGGEMEFVDVEFIVFCSAMRFIPINMRRSSSSALDEDVVAAFGAGPASSLTLRCSLCDEDSSWLGLRLRTAPGTASSVSLGVLNPSTSSSSAPA